ncbi:TPA: ATP-binding cassette domain-containing protein [Bacillus wiedmannii]|uniref:AAA family ATPase n=1 Tax=Bacillus wiedmannii TaxID=1890302 RepID=UPI000BF4585A|nr:AAA family ATPase [Bacillus wiedmannii]PEP54021.1 hypothetical protein CN557_08110 [Bacillus wiedmannii]HDX9652509.1 ATP-binding cassette domain-containing protein [Bacillus wiedmannii]
MQILYLWINQQQNLKNLSLNFGGEILFNITNDTLTVEENPYYIEDFFFINDYPDKQTKINTVTGIVGENGTGKSTILKLIREIITDTSKIKFQFFIVYKANNTLYYDFNLENDLHYNQKKINKSTSFSSHDRIFIRKNINSAKFHTAVFSNIYDLTAHTKIFNDNDNIFDLSTNSLYQNVSYFTNEIYNQILFVKKVENELGISSKINIPKEIEVNVFNSNQILGQYKDLYEKLNVEIIEKVIPKLVQNELEENYTPFLAKTYESIYSYFCFYISNRIHEKYLLPYSLIRHTFLITTDKDNFFNNFEDFFHTFLIELKQIYKKEFYKNQNNKEFVNKNIDVVIESLEDKYIAIRDFINLLPSLNVRSEKFISSNDPYVFDFLSLYEKCKFEIPLFELFWSELSSGEYAFLNLFSRFNTITNKVEKDLIILIDEGDLYFHPQWQKDWLYTFMDFISYLFKETNIHIILTTHSPFILSDLPSNNVIFLKKDTSNNIGTVKNLEGNQLTFAANIHDLLTNSFFMHGGLVGKFAQNKINNLIDEILDSPPEKIRQNSSRIRKQIDIIGEPIVKRKLIELFEDKIKLDVLSINEKIERLQQQIDELKAIKNDKN